MRALHRLAIVVLVFEMPVPFYWLVLHAGVGFWRSRKRTRGAYLAAVLIAWGVVGTAIVHFRAQLFAVEPSLRSIVAGVLLIVSDAFLLTSVEMELGGHRLVGHAELTNRGEMTARGLYRYVRHPRYLGMILGVFGACLLGGSQLLWIAAACWLGIVFAVIWLEDRELRVRFGPEYAAYAKRVPALLPVRRAR